MKQDVGSAMKLDIINKYLKEALKEAYKAYDLAECPIGAIIVKDNKIIARGYNKRELAEDPLGHAEIIAIKKASKKLNTWRFDDCIMFVTLEPCIMCAGAIINSRIKEVYFGALDKRNGAVCSNLDSFNKFTHKPIYHYLENEDCSKILTNFFTDLRYNIDITKIKIETKRLILRPFSMLDLDDFYEYAKVDGVGEMAGWQHHKNVDESRIILNDLLSSGEILAIYHKEDKKVIGSVGIHKRFHHEFKGLKYREIGYVLSKDYWHNGYMKESLNNLISYLFNENNLDVLVACHFNFNEASKKVILSQKFKYFKSSIIKGNKSSYYYLMKEDLK